MTKLAKFLTILQQLDTTDGLPAIEYSIHSMPLAMRDVETRKSIAAMTGLFNIDVATAVWELALQKPGWDHTVRIIFTADMNHQPVKNTMIE